MILPACVKLFAVGRLQQQGTTAADSSKNLVFAQSHRRYLLWGVTNTSLAFFLASFQVHEKSLLMAVAPVSVLAGSGNSTAAFGDWFALVATWTLWPLLTLDRLQVAYACVMILFGVFLVFIRDFQSTLQDSEQALPHDSGGVFHQLWLLRAVPHLSALVVLGLHATEAVVEPPESMADLFPVLWSIAGCGFCLFAWGVSIWELYRSDIHAIKEKNE